MYVYLQGFSIELCDEQGGSMDLEKHLPWISIGNNKREVQKKQRVISVTFSYGIFLQGILWNRKVYKAFR
jgi:hypothetical protein